MVKCFDANKENHQGCTEENNEWYPQKFTLNSCQRDGKRKNAEKIMRKEIMNIDGLVSSFGSYLLYNCSACGIGVTGAIRTKLNSLFGKYDKDL